MSIFHGDFDNRKMDEINSQKSKTRPLKVLVASQKGGVGKSTLSANFAAYCGRILKKKTLLLDCDPHASASSWLKALEPENVEVKHHLINDFTAQRWYIGMRNIIRKNLQGFDFLVCDLTWTKSMSAEFVKEFDLIIIPTSVSLIEIDATNIFIEENLKRSAKTNTLPDVLICPSQVMNDELKSNPFDSQTFKFPFFLLPPIPSDPQVRALFEKGYAFESEDFIANSFKKVFRSILQAGRLRKERISRERMGSNNVSKSFRVSDNQGHVGKKVLSKEISHEQPKKVQKDNVTAFKSPNQLDKVKRILEGKKKQKSSWIRRLVSW